MNVFVFFTILVVTSCASAQLPSNKPGDDFTLDLTSDGNSIITDGNGDFTEMSFEDFMFNLERDFQRITGELCRECFGHRSLATRECLKAEPEERFQIVSNTCP